MNNEDIKLLKSIVKVHNTFLKGCKKETITAREIQAIENLLKENEELRNNSVPVAKIKEKIKELEKEYNEILADYGNIDTDVIFNIPNENVRKYLEKLADKIITLQELLEGK